MGVMGWILVGGVAGWLASKLMRTDREQGCLLDILLGVAGGWLGGYVLQFFGYQVPRDEIGFPILLTAFGGSLLLLFVGKKLWQWKR